MIDISFRNCKRNTEKTLFIEVLMKNLSMQTTQKLQFLKHLSEVKKEKRV